jgi:hypothetical protein
VVLDGRIQGHQLLIMGREILVPLVRIKPFVFRVENGDRK